ncbi:Coenzyme F420 hydrogenase/dehydrogenase, beta subunit C-terminal domain [Arcobacter sp. CECT 8985]|uniref:Coenzyme F420 hydrogenase/dehydrogenase, beta subunit C-terminal domain n=1 Tax=Arcobacter sp. CECT 8985 TaxID=1935424 RepID=UPI00100A6318|nr:Coenzyme F420 hydrogenase/dehydrogenase, beta subunit C-terminal domain [Arcobacter sp. CECT 8985]RXJ87169.1 hypothetical protein CRU93_05375 [Arcobacter sp. CECT 8985]
MKKVSRDITEVVDNYLCHSCGSCFSSCGHDCISYETTTMGYLFPKIDYNSCTNCGLCFDVCPGDHFSIKLKEKTKEIDPFIGNIKTTYVGYSNDKEIYNNSQSGGITTEILRYLLDNDIVSAAVVTVMNEEMSASKAKIITSSKELKLSQKSKYLPTNLNSLVPELLKIKGKIAVVGLSCHIQGLENLKKIKRKLNDKLIKIGLICEKIMLNSSLDYFTNELSIKTQQIKEFSFKDPYYTKYPGDISLVTKDNNRFFLDRKYRKNMKDFFTPIRCMLCFDKMNIYSDIVLGDPHGIDNINDESGENLVLIRTEIGTKIIEEMMKLKLITLREVSTDDAITGQGIEKKRKKFNSYINAWKNLGKKIPDYPQSVFDFSIATDEKDIKKSEMHIQSAIELDKIQNKDEILKKARHYYENKNGKKTFFRYFKKIFR